MILVGQMLARMHVAGSCFSMQQPHLRGLAWWAETAPVVLPHLQPAQAELLQSELSELEGDIDGAIRSSPAWQAGATSVQAIRRWIGL